MSSFYKESDVGVRKILFYILVVMIVICETPYLSRNTNTMIVEGLMIVFVMLTLIERRIMSKQYASIIASIFLYFLLEITYKIIGFSSAGIGYYFATLKFLFILFGMASIGTQLSKKQTWILCIVSIGGMFANMISNIFIYLQMNPSAYVVYYLRDGQSTNAADTAFASAVMILMGALFIVFMRSQQKAVRLLSLLGAGFCAYFLIFIAQRGTTFFLGIAMIIFICMFNTSSKRLMISLMLLLVFVLWLSMGGVIVLLNCLANLLSGLRIDYKITYLINYFQTGDLAEAGGSLSGRYDLINRSVETFSSSIRSILIGVGDHRDNNFLIGNHSLLIDTLARYGLLGGMCLTWLLTSMKKTIFSIASIYDQRLYRQIMIIFAFFLLRCFLGNAFVGSVATQLFVTVPLIARLLNWNGENNEEIRDILL